MQAVIEFIEAYWIPLALGVIAIVCLLGDMPVAALAAAFTAGVTFREIP
jgi:hypothetical protein